MLERRGWGGAALAVWLLCACGESPPQTSLGTAETAGEERPQAEEGMQVTGLRGTLSPHEIHAALEPRLGKFSRCAQQRSPQVEWLAGEIEFEFHVALDGSVTQAYPKRSSMGDRDTERCMTEVARATRFPRPRGGEADFAWSLEIPLDPEVREPVAWTGEALDEVRLLASEQVAADCGSAAFSVTAYVDPDGRVVAAGAAAPDGEGHAALDCVVQVVQALTFPSPGSYAAKVAFALPPG